jgi:hypothetical protein
VPENISMKTNCPICHKIISFDCEKDYLLNSKSFPILFLIEHCNESLIVHVDESLEVKKVLSVSNILERRDTGSNQERMHGEPVTASFIQKMPLEERMLLASNYNYDNLIKMQLPNVLEKQIILQIAKSNEISFAILLKKIVPLEKALNRTIDHDLVQKIVDKYVGQGLIKKRLISFNYGISGINEYGLHLGEDLG